MGVDQGCYHVSMPHDLFEPIEIHAALNGPGCERMAEAMVVYFLR